MGKQKIYRHEFWFEEKPEKVKNPKKFIEKVLRLHARMEPWEGGLSVAQYVGLIKNEKIKKKFIAAIDEMLADEKTEDWIKEELDYAKKELAVNPTADYLNEWDEEKEKKFLEELRKIEENKKKKKRE